MLKIAILGKAGVGKNTIATMIASDIMNLKTHEYKISAFANKIKEITTLMFPNCSQEAMYGNSELRQNRVQSDLDKVIEILVSFRQVALDIGKLGRRYNPLFWVGHIANEYLNLDKEIKLYIIGDLRFREEYEWLKAHDFVMCRVKRDTELKIDDISETDQDGLSDDKFDIIIDNNCSIEELRKRVTDALDSHYSNNEAYLQVRNAAN